VIIAPIDWHSLFPKDVYCYPIPGPTSLDSVQHHSDAVAIILLVHPERRQVDSARHAVGLDGTTMQLRADKRNAFVLCDSLPELEFPHIPCKNTIFMGPIVTPDPPLSETNYPDLARFLDAGRTVVVNMGSLFQSTNQDAAELADAFVEARVQLAHQGWFTYLVETTSYPYFPTYS
jgi:hypothetical protein